MFCVPGDIELQEYEGFFNTVGLVVEYSPATGETRVRFPDGVLGVVVSKTVTYIFRLAKSDADICFLRALHAKKILKMQEF